MVTRPDHPDPLEQLTLDQLRTRTSLKWTTHPADVLPLWVAEMDVLLAPPVARAVHDAVASGDTGYPNGSGYARALGSFARARWGWDGVEVDRTAVVADVMTGVVEALRLVTGPGDAVVVCPPVYPPFAAFVAHADRRVVEAPLGPDHRLDLDVLADALSAARRSSARPALLLCNPHNPTGTAHTRAELTAVAALARRHGVRVLSDEIHAPLVLPGARFVPYLSVPGAEDAFALFSASKGWNLAGLKAAVLVAGPDAADDLARLPEVVDHGPSHLGVLAHTTAFEHGREWLDALLTGLDHRRDLLVDLLAEHLPQVGMVRPEATYLAWLDCRRFGLHSPGPRSGAVTDLEDPAGMFLDRARVALSSGPVFGTGGAGHVRLNYATSSAVLRAALERMGDAARTAGGTG
ncbi:MAG: Cystathionine beta-lyase, type II [uncultured Pseudonocardia sp.]|uniref:cysteine-S-conjugate beta-lyase n=1 Tax=uncultured Pseudonocardia sp. TaxID=211455 RepID=A0A6J4Q944_9PSEU|nr:MAG: Cystathionine beta-lyase, type II [uncultured Pseudonocardia sp.]